MKAKFKLAIMSPAYNIVDGVIIVTVNFCAFFILREYNNYINQLPFLWRYNYSKNVLT